MVGSASKDEFRAEAQRLRTLHANDPAASFLAPLVTLNCFRRASSVALYIPFGLEPETADIIAHCHESGKRVGVPAWLPETRRYGFCSLPCGADMAPGHMRIPEPIHKNWTPVSDYDIVLIPALLFDRLGTRLGHGKGYYDRLLADRSPHTTLIGLAFDWQIAKQTLPRDAHDVPMDLIVTPQGAVAVSPLCHHRT